MTRPNAWIMVPCEHPGCEAVMRRDRYRKYKYRLCRKHWPARPMTDEIRANVSAGVKRLAERRPDLIADRNRKAVEAKRRRYETDPAYRQQMQEHARQMGREHGGRVEGLDYHKVAAKATATKLAHIPLAYRREYVELMRRHKLPATERARIVLEQAAADARRHHADSAASMTKPVTPKQKD